MIGVHYYIIQVVFMIGTILSNIVMLWFFALSIGNIGVTKATVYNFAVTYVESILLGYFVFGEDVTYWKLISMTFIILGVHLISQGKFKVN